MGSARKDAYPRTVRVGAAMVTIYRFEREGRPYPYFSVAYYQAGIRRQKQFRDEDEALREARWLAGQISAGKLQAMRQAVSTEDLALLRQFQRDAQPLSVAEAFSEWRRAREIVGDEVLEACRHWKNTRMAKPGATVAKVVEDFLKKRRAVGRAMTNGAAKTLPRFAEDFADTHIANVTADMIESWLAKFSHPVTRNSNRARLVTLFRWCRDAGGYLPQERRTAAETVEASVEPPRRPPVMTASHLESILEAVGAELPQYLPALALAAFCGLRRAEVHAQVWEDLLLPRRLLRVTAAKPNTPAYRLVPVPAPVADWLAARAATGRVCTTLDLDRVRELARHRGLTMPENGLRHTWISARVAITSNLHEVSLHAGNSPDMIRQHYLELLTNEEAEAWFGAALRLPSAGAEKSATVSGGA